MDRTFGRYTFHQRLGRGGMGEVWEAYDTVHRRVVALKILRPEYAEDPSFRERFLREAHLAARIAEPHVIPIHDFGEVEGQLFIDMRIVRGEDLRNRLHRDGPLDWSETLSIAQQLASALDAAHADGLVHRDVKPANVLITNGFAYLADFGIAVSTESTQLTGTSMLAGSLDYIAPERLSDQPATARSDIYSLACVIFECLTGTPPFTATNPAAKMTAHLYSEPPQIGDRLAGLPAAAGPTLQAALAKDPAERQASAGELVAQLQRAMPTSDTEVVTLDRTADLPGGPEDEDPTRLVRFAASEAADAIPAGRRSFTRRQKSAAVAGVAALAVLGGGTFAARELLASPPGLWVTNDALRMTAYYDPSTGSLSDVQAIDAPLGKYWLSQGRNVVQLNTTSGDTHSITVLQTPTDRDLHETRSFPAGFGVSEWATDGQDLNLVQQPSMGRYWVFAADDLSSFDGTRIPDATGPVNAVALVEENTLALVDRATGTYDIWEYADGKLAKRSSGRIFGYATLIKQAKDLAFDKIGDTVISYSPSLGILATPTRQITSVPTDATLQRSGPAADQVFLADSASIASVDLRSGTVKRWANPAPGKPAAPVVGPDGCLYAVWDNGQFMSICDATVVSRHIKNTRAGDAIVLRTNFSSVFANDATQGTVYSFADDSLTTWDDGTSAGSAAPMTSATGSSAR